jgi:hypothetical protein
MSEAPSLKLEDGECITLSPTSERFKSAYRQVQPRRAEDVRKILGFSEAGAKALAQNTCCSPAPTFTPRPEDLDAEDPEIRIAARRAAAVALQAFVNSATPAAFAYLTPALDRFLEITKAVINVVTLCDIEVGNGATLTISPSTLVVYANKVIIHGTGRIVCDGPTTFKITSLEGIRPIVPPIAVGGASAVSLARQPSSQRRSANA